MASQRRPTRADFPRSWKVFIVVLALMGTTALVALAGTLLGDHLGNAAEQEATENSYSAVVAQAHGQLAADSAARTSFAAAVTKATAYDTAGKSLLASASGFFDAAKVADFAVDLQCLESGLKFTPGSADQVETANSPTTVVEYAAATGARKSATQTAATKTARIVSATSALLDGINRANADLALITGTKIPTS